ncbi:MAG: hypothetical protein WC617_12230 [Rhodanobacter sp.]
MARFTGAVRFSDDSLMYFVYNGVVDVARPQLFATVTEAEAAWDDTPDFAVPRDVRDAERVEVMPYYVGGDHEVMFLSQASKTLRLITGPRDLDSAMRAQDY